MPTLTLDRLTALLRQYTAQTGQPIDLLLIGGLAMSAYGHPSRATIDIDGELREGVRPLKEFLSGHGIPANLGQSLSGWSVVAMPPGYRDRATILIDEPKLRVTLLAPVDFIVAKLRRGTDEDLEDAVPRRKAHCTLVLLCRTRRLRSAKRLLKPDVSQSHSKGAIFWSSSHALALSQSASSSR